nr:DNA excision repair protein ERCC-5 homolog isoform X2 [Hydra vulgaris]
MGVKGLWQLLAIAGKPVSLESLDGKILAIDVSIWLNKAVKGMRDKHGNQVYNAHLVLMFHRICKLLFYGIKPVFVFDGNVPELKKNTQKLRRSYRLKAEACKGKIDESLINNFLKSKALECVTGKKSTLKLKLQKSNEPDIFQLPAFQEKKVESSDEDDTSWLDAINSDELKDMFAFPELVDLNSAEFLNLPPQVKHELLIEIQEVNRKRSKRKHSPDVVLPKDSDEFSNFQLSNLVKRGKITDNIRSLRKEMNNSLSEEYLEYLNIEHDTKTKEVQAKRLISNEKESFVFIKTDKSKEKNVLFTTNIEDGYTQFDMKKHKEEAVKLKNIERAAAQFKKISYQFPNCMLSDDSSDSSESGKEIQLDSSGRSFLQENFEFMFNSSISDDEQIKNSDDDSEKNVHLIQLDRNLENSNDIRKNQNQIKGFRLVGILDVNETVDIKTGSNKLLEITERECSKNLLNINNTSIVEIFEPDKFDKSLITPVFQKKTISNNYIEPVSTIYPVVEEDSIVEDIKEGKNICDIVENIQVESVPQSIQEDHDVDHDVDDHIQEDHVVDHDVDDHVQGVYVVDHGVGDHIKKDRVVDHDGDDHIQKNHVVDDHVDNHVKKDYVVDYVNDHVQGDHVVECVQEDLDSKTIQEDANKKNPIKSEIIKSTSTEFNKIQHEKTKEDFLKLEVELNKEKIELELETRKQTRQAATLSAEVYNDVQDLLQLFGIPYLVSPMEAEAQCAALNLLKLTNGTITDDSDIFLFGAENVYKNIFNKDKIPECYSSKDLETLLYLTREKLIAVAFLTGSDYTEGLPGVGGITAMEILQAFAKKTAEETLANFRAWVMSPNVTGNKVLDRLKAKLALDGIPSNFNSNEVWEAYLNPIVDQSKEKFEWGNPDIESIKQFASDKMAWSFSNTLETLKPLLEKWKEKAKLQRTIDTYFMPKIKFGSGKEASKRLQNVLNDLSRSTGCNEDLLKPGPSETNDSYQIDSSGYCKAEIPKRKKRTASRKKLPSTVSSNHSVQLKKEAMKINPNAHRIKSIPPLVKVKDINAVIRRRFGKSASKK